MAAPDKKQMWVDWTHDAVSGYSPDGSVDDTDELVDDMADVATKYADSMLDEYEDRFGSSGSSGRRRKRKAADDND